MNDAPRALFQDRRKLAVLAAVLVAVAVALAFALTRSSEVPPAAAGPLEEPVADEPTEEPEVEPTPVGFGVLTGAPVYDAEALERPIVATKVENTAAARPQAGLDVADIVFEELVEGGSTRFLALFQSEVPDAVGPIRSGRPEDAVVLPPYSAMFYLSGARGEVLGQFRSAGLTFIDEDGHVMRRDSSRRAPHNVFAAGETMFSYAAERVGPGQPAGFTFDAQPPAGETTGSGVSVRVAMSRASVTSFEYDEEAGVYRRFQNDQPQAVTGDGQVGADNVVVFGMRVGDGGCCDTAGSRYTATTVHGEGPAVIYRDGRRYEARWSKPSAGDHFTIAAADGSRFPLKPGRSWVLFAPVNALP